MRRLTTKQERFCQAYIQAPSATAAYLEVYNCQNMKPQTVNRKATELKNLGIISARISELQEGTADKLLVSDGSVLKTLSCIAFSDIRRLFKNNRLKGLEDIDNATAAAISSIKVVTKQVGGGEVEYVHEIKFWSKTTALDALSKHLGLFEKDNKQKAEHVVILHDPSRPDGNAEIHTKNSSVTCLE